MKRITAFLLALTMVLALMGCGAKEEQTQQEKAEQPAAAGDEQPKKETAAVEPTKEPEFKMPERNHQTISAGEHHLVAVRTDGTAVATGYNGNGECDVQSWTDLVAVAAGYFHTLGLRSDGTVVATGVRDHKECNVEEWMNIVAVAAGSYHSVGLRSDGTVVATGSNMYGQCAVKDWTNIVAIAAGPTNTVGLRADGTVVTTADSNDFGELDVEDWRDITVISTNAVGTFTVGLRSDGTVVATGMNDDGQCDVADWTNIVAIDTGLNDTVGLRSDGTVIFAGWNYDGGLFDPMDVSGWTNIVAVAVGNMYIAGLRADGTVVATGVSFELQEEASRWTDIRLPSGRISESSTPAEDGERSAGGDPRQRLTDYEGEWEMVGEPNSILIFREEDGAPTIYAEFYRMAAFTALLNTAVSESDCLVYQSVDGFTCRVWLNTDSVTVRVETADDYAGYFEDSAFEYKRHEGDERQDWLGKWVSADGNGEYIEVTEVDVYGIELTFHRLTASGESYTDTDYSLTFEGPGVRWAVEDASVIEASGWRYSFELNDGYIIAYSRYPDQRFNKQ